MTQAAPGARFPLFLPKVNFEKKYSQSSLWIFVNFSLAFPEIWKLCKEMAAGFDETSCHG